MDIKNKIAKIITQTHKTPFEQAEEILQLFAENNESKQLLQSRVVGQSEQLCQNKYDTILSEPITYCQKCGKYHN